MPHVFGPKWIRLRTPVTSDGRTLVYGDDGKILYTEMDVPLSARAVYERENSRVAAPYRHIIQEMNEDMAPNPETLVKGAGAPGGKKSKKDEPADSLV